MRVRGWVSFLRFEATKHALHYNRLQVKGASVPCGLSVLRSLRFKADRI